MAPDKGMLDSLKINRSKPAASRSSGWIMALVLALVVLGIGWMAWSRGRSALPVVLAATVQEVSSAGQQTRLNASGYVTARRQATVSSKVTGKVVEVLIEEGMEVKASQVLARIDASNIQANLRLAESQLEAARAALAETKVLTAQAEREWRRTSELAATRISSQSELDRAEADARALQARLERQVADVAVMEREVAIWSQQMDDTFVRAPFAGIVTAKNAQPGEMISPVSAGGGFTRTGICTIVDMASLEIEVDVSESYINRVAADQPVVATLDAYPDGRIPAKVIAIIPTADRQKATVKVRIGFEKLDPRVLPEMGVKVAFQAAGEAPVASSRALSIPKAAVRSSEGRDAVWVLRDERVERRVIVLGPARGDQVEVQSGLAAGERVVISGVGDLKEGMRVQVK